MSSLQCLKCWYVFTSYNILYVYVDLCGTRDDNFVEKNTSTCYVSQCNLTYRETFIEIGNVKFSTSVIFPLIPPFVTIPQMDLPHVRSCS